MNTTNNLIFETSDLWPMIVGLTDWENLGLGRLMIWPDIKTMRGLFN